MRILGTLAVVVTTVALGAQAQEAEVAGPVVQDTDAIDRIEDATGSTPVTVAIYPLYDDEGYLMPPLDPSVVAER